MKPKLNLNEPSTNLVRAIGVFLVAIPAALYIASVVLGGVAIQFVSLSGLITLSLIIGLSLVGILFVLVIVEQIQDHFMNARHQKHRDRKLRVADGYYECQFCGSRRVRWQDTHCPVCGSRLKNVEADYCGPFTAR